MISLLEYDDQGETTDRAVPTACMLLNEGRRLFFTTYRPIKGNVTLETTIFFILRIKTLFFIKDLSIRLAVKRTCKKNDENVTNVI